MTACTIQLDRFIRTALAAVLVLAATAVGQRDYERWYVLELNGSQAGWSHDERRTEGDLIRSSSELSLTIRREQQSIRIRYGWDFVETADGQPVRITRRVGDGQTPEVTEYEFLAEGVRCTTRQAGQERVATLPMPEGTWLPPAAATEFLRVRLAAGAKSIEVRTLDPSEGIEPMVIRYMVEGRDTVEVLGRRIGVHRCVSEQQSGGEVIRSREWIDEEGLLVRMETDSLGLDLAMRLATREEATAQAEPPEIMVSTFIRPDRRIGEPRSATTALYVLTLRDDAMPDLPETGAQRVERLDDHRVRVVVDVGNGSLAPEPDAANEAFTAASSKINSEDDAIRSLTARALRGAPGDGVSRCEVLRRFVHEFIERKDLGVAFASASDVARSRQGDCSEHAMLLAAMLRADGIPSRVVSGLIYTEDFAGERDVFAYHMWTQALARVDGGHRWIDLDATLPPGRAFDATHIALVASAMGDNDGYSSMVPLVRLLGRLEVEVESVR